MSDADTNHTVQVDVEADAKSVADINAADLGVPPRQAAQAAPAQDDDEKVSLRAEIQRQRDAAARERAARIELEQRSAQNESAAVDNQVLAVKNLRAAKTAEIANVKTALRAAREAGDYDKEVDLSEALARLAAEGVRLDEAIQFEATQAEQRKVQQQRQPAPQDQRQQFLASLRNPRAREWVIAHDAFPGTPQYEQAMRAHHSALGQGIPAESDEYFAHLDAQIGGGRQAQQQRQQQPRQQSYVAPASPRQPSNGTRVNGNGRSLQLGPKTRQTAAELEMTEQEYAKFALEEIDAGRANPNDYLN